MRLFKYSFISDENCRWHNDHTKKWCVEWFSWLSNNIEYQLWHNIFEMISCMLVTHIVFLINMLRKNNVFKWTKLKTNNFATLKITFVKQEFVSIYESKEQIIFHKNASNKTLETYVFWKNKSITFYFIKLTSIEVNYITTNKKLLTIFIVLKH